MSRPADQIVFQDLHGNPDSDGVDLEVDLNAGTPGITRKAASDDVADDDDRPSVAADADDSDSPEDDTRGDAGQPSDEDRGSRARRNEFEARLERERRAKRRERQRAEELEAENVRLRKRLEKARSSSFPSKEQIDSQITAAELQLEQAIEKGDTKEQVRVTSSLTDLKARRIAAEYGPPPDDDDDEAPMGSDVRKTSQNELVEEWKERHADWYRRPGFEKQTRLANKIDREIFAEGFETHDPDYYKELDKRLRKVAPEVFDDPDGKPARSRGRSPVAGTSQTGAVDAMKRGTVRLEQDDLVNMRRFGLDPNNADVLREYARNKRQIAMEESSR